jgi:hypothetical protein
MFSLTFGRKEFLVKKLADEKQRDRFDGTVFTWLLQQLHLTNQAIVPVLHATRLRAIKPDYQHLYDQSQF